MKKASRNQMLGAFGYSEPDRDCPDFYNDSIAGKSLNYRLLGCLCCDHNTCLKPPKAEGAAHRANEIHLRCDKGHTLVVAVLKEDKEGSP